MQKNKILLFYVPFPDQSSAKISVKTLMSKRLIACANIVEGRSVYFWEGALKDESEVVCLMKTVASLEADLEAAIAELHPYDCPAILRMEMSANEAYAQWIKQETEDGERSLE